MGSETWQRADRGGGRICEVCKQAIGRRTPAMRRDEETSDFRGDDTVTFRHLHCHQTRALSDKVWAERGGPALLAEVVRLREALTEIARGVLDDENGGDFIHKAYTLARAALVPAKETP